MYLKITPTSIEEVVDEYDKDNNLFTIVLTKQ